MKLLNVLTLVTIAMFVASCASKKTTTSDSAAGGCNHTYSSKGSGDHQCKSGGCEHKDAAECKSSGCAHKGEHSCKSGSCEHKGEHCCKGAECGNKECCKDKKECKHKS